MNEQIIKKSLLTIILMSTPLLLADNIEKKAHQRATISEAQKEAIIEDSDFVMPSAGALANSLKMIFGDIQWSQFIDIKRKAIAKTDREKALNLGIEGADLFFLAISQDVDNLTKVSISTNRILDRIIIKNKSINTNDRKRKLKKLRDLIKAEKWKIVLREISSLKEEINSDFRAKDREDLALLNDIGGWLEGYRLTVEAMNSNYKGAESMILLQAPLISYLLKELQSSQKLKTFSKRGKLIDTLVSINSLLSKAKNFHLSKDEVSQLSNIFGGKIKL